MQPRKGIKNPRPGTPSVDEQEVEEWYDEERERLETAYYDGALASLDADQLKAAFDHGLRQLLTDYQRRQEKLASEQRRRAALQKPIARARAWMEERRRGWNAWWARRATIARTWLFHQRIKRILR